MIPSPPPPRESPAWRLLRDGVPLSLLCDLLVPDGPASREILAVEALADDVRACHPPGGSSSAPGASISTA